MIAIANRSASSRIFFLKSGRVSIAPKEIYFAPADQEEDVKQLIKSKFFRSLVDLGLMEASSKKSDIARMQQTPTPPATLSTSKRIEGTGIVVSANQDAQFNANPESEMKVIGSAEV
jgi:hypothetical protein